MDRAPSSGSTLHRVRAGLLLVNALLAALLAVTGLLLLAGYRPGSALATLHGQTGQVLLVTALLSLVLLLVPRPRLAAAAAAVGLLAAALLAFGTGPLVAWQGLIAWGAAVEAGRTSFAGYLWLLGDDVRFAVVNRTELEPSTVVFLLTFHLALGVATALVALAATTTGRFPGRRVRGTRASAPRAGQPQIGEPRAADPRASEPRAADPRATEPRVTEPRAAEPRATEPRAAEPRIPGPREGGRPSAAGTGAEPPGGGA